MSGVRLQQYERALARVPAHPRPTIALEQYRTPPDLAARLVFELAGLGDLARGRVIDLGAGTGMLSIAAAMFGAPDVVGLDVDPAALRVARTAAADLDVADQTQWVVGDIAQACLRGEVALTNPPFGTRQRHADRPFLDHAFSQAPVAVVIHHAEAVDHVDARAASHGKTRTHGWRLGFDLPHQYAHQSRATKTLAAVALRYA